MRFITELELKMQYRKAPFTQLKLPLQTRLTPEARQFLVDRKIKICQQEACEDELVKEKLPVQNDSNNEKFVGVFQKTISFFLLSFSFLLEKDVSLAEQVLGWQKHLEAVQKAWEQGTSIPIFPKTETKQRLEKIDNLEVSAFHVQLPYGRELAILNCLKASLVELIVYLNEAVDYSPEEKKRVKNIQVTVIQIKRELLQVMTQMIRSERR